MKISTRVIKADDFPQEFGSTIKTEPIKVQPLKRTVHKN